MRSAVLAALLGFGASAYASVQQKCSNNICYSLSIPASTANSGNGDIYMQITGPTSFAWIGLGQGSKMAGAQFFVVYSSSNGQNVTLSPRLSSGEVMPQYNSNAQVELLEGSGISNGQMVANIKCSNCSSWNGGSMDLKASSTTWIHAANSGNALNTDSKSATIQQHQNIYGTLGFDSSAQGGSDVNPFLTSSTTSGSGTASATSSGTTATSTSQGSFSSTNGESHKNRLDAMRIAHGVLASLAFVIFFPLGAIAMGVLSFPHLVAVHAAFQVFAFILYIVAFALGVIVADDLEEIGEYHPIIGIVLFALVAIQPVLGVLHHNGFKVHGRRTPTTYAHIWLGRIVITLGIINGGLGLMLAANTTGGEIAYGVVAGLMWIAFAAASVVGEIKKSKKRDAQTTPSKWEQSSGQMSPETVEHNGNARI